MSAQTKMVQAEGARLHVRMAGPEQAPAVVLLHGFPLHGGMWDAQVDALAKDWRVIVPDFRGHGQSEVGDGQYAIDFFVDDLLAVLDSTTSGPVVACGLSMGGYVLLRALERAPERFRAVVLADTRSGTDRDPARLKRIEGIRTLRAEGAAGYAEGFAKSALGKTTLEQRPEVVTAVRAMAAAGDPRGLIGALLAMAGRTDTTDGAGQVAVPALVIVGDEDALTPPDHARELATRIKEARLVVIPGAGHLTPMEAPEEFTAALRGFLEGLSAPG
jgi:pimeloyl-ACP methyl ester carboxylesterase